MTPATFSPEETVFDAVIWDMGGIIYLTPFEMLDRVEADNGWPHGALSRGPFSRKGDPEYAKCSTGELSESAYWAAYQERAIADGYPLDLASIDWTDGLRTVVMDTIRALQGQVIQATLSNDSSAWLGTEWWESWPHSHLFAATIDVETLGIRKPHPDTYRTAAERIGVSIDRCLFVDDMQVNVDGAEAMGMAGFHFDHTDADRSCRRLLKTLSLN